MSDYVSRDAVIQAIEYYCDMCTKPDHKPCKGCSIDYAIEQVKTVDALIMVTEDNFCSHGERREAVCNAD